jgi:hypothetical protein
MIYLIEIKAERAQSVKRQADCPSLILRRDKAFLFTSPITTPEPTKFPSLSRA